MRLGKAGAPRMSSVQIALSDTAYRRALIERLGETDYTARSVDRPEPSTDDVLVVDVDHLRMLPLPIDNPERVVMIADRAAGHFSEAWDAGVSSVVDRRDSLGTAVMAVLSACLRSRRPPGGARARPREALSPEPGS